MPVLGAASNALTYTTYRVVSGDNLWNLARRYKTTTSAIASASGIDADATLKIGQSLRIPITASTTPVQPAAAAPAPAQPLPARTDGTAAVAVPWSVVNKLWPDRADAQITDVKTGMKFTVARRAGWAHADIEPKTRADTAIMKKIFLGKWTWDRRAVVFEYDGRRIAASLAGYPHGGEYIVDNGVLGVFDLHFLGSTTHGSAWTVNRKPTVDPDHQAMVQAAVGH
jgi:murein DD-endopeptidase MepM/ murein hydrolase activator NlpD